jgi:hypothetical protein
VREGCFQSPASRIFSYSSASERFYGSCRCFSFGLPIVAIVGQFLRVHASYRKYIKELSDSEQNILYLFSENADGFDMVRGKNFGHVAWENVRKVIERPRYFRFVLNKYESIIIPKRFLACGSDERIMKEIMLHEWGIERDFYDSAASPNNMLHRTNALPLLPQTNQRYGSSGRGG